MRVAITDPALLERQTLPDADFPEHYFALAANFPARAWSGELFERGLRYPWYRPRRTYRLRDGTAAEVDELPELPADRVGLLAIGGNASPKYLSLKLAHHEDPADREVLVVAGELHDFDVVAYAAVAIYGAMAATLAHSPGTAVRAGLLLVTANQLTTLAWGEIPYRIGRLRGATFTADAGVEFASPLAFVSRWGAFAPGGVPAPLAAIPARDRTQPAWTQRELLDRAAQIVLGPDRDAEALSRVVCERGGAFARTAIPALRPFAQPFGFPGWAPMAPDGTFP